VNRINQSFGRQSNAEHQFLSEMPSRRVDYKHWNDHANSQRRLCCEMMHEPVR
jgi:hypothetical protein